MHCVGGGCKMHKPINYTSGRDGALIDHREFKGVGEWGEGGRKVSRWSEDRLVDPCSIQANC